MTSRETPSATQPALDVRNLCVSYPLTDGNYLAALRDVDLRIQPGEIVGVVGESGSGKSTLNHALMGLLPPGCKISGGIDLMRHDIIHATAAELRELRGKSAAIIFQDALAALNPSLTIGRQLSNVLAAHSPDKGRAIQRARILEMLEQVGLPDGAQRLDYYPHQLSGGMRQRVMIAMAFLLNPAVLISDEATSALDATMEAQIIELLRQLHQARGSTIIFTSHHLGSVAQLCDRIIVMYAGRIVEDQPASDLFANPLHPYTRALLGIVRASGVGSGRGRRLPAIPGQPPHGALIKPGCSFAPRCNVRTHLCHTHMPKRTQAGQSAAVWCHDVAQTRLPT